LMAVTNVGPAVLGAGRIAALGHISGAELDPAGSTSIGAGVVAGKAALDAAQALGTPHYDVTAMLVLTDGEENTAPLLSAVGGSITANTFVIGLGQPQNISTVALATLTQGHNGYLLITGTLTPDQSARLNKYFLQILAGVTNAQIVLDPHGVLTHGAVHRIPFQVAETEYGLDVFLLTQSPWAVDFELEAPNGELLSPSSVVALPNARYVQAAGMAYYRLSLPADPAKPDGTRGGLWNVLLKLGKPKLEAYTYQSYVAGAAASGGLAYDVVVHCYSNLTFRAQVTQSGFDPGASVTVHAALTEYDVPVDHRGYSWAEVTRPDNSTFLLAMSETDPGRFLGAFIADIAGLYTIRARATGSTFSGAPFQREQTLSAAVYPGASQPPQIGGTGSEWCSLLRCLVGSQVIDRALVDRLRQQGLNLDSLLKCLEACCASKPYPPLR